MTQTMIQVAADVAALLRAKNTLLWVTTREEARVESYLIKAARSAGYICRTWDYGQGVAEITGVVNTSIGSTDPGETLKAIQERAFPPDGRQVQAERCVWIMRDLPIWLAGPIGAGPQRMLRNLARSLPVAERARAQAIIVLTPSADIPPELSGHATMIECPLPDRPEIVTILDAAIAAMPDGMQDGAAPNGTRDQAIDAAVGLTYEEAASCFSKSLVQLKRIDPQAVASEKKRIVAKSGVLEYFDPLPGGLDAVGGLLGLKAWLAAHKTSFTAAARAYGLPTPKGLFLVGVSGCGKSLSIKAIASSWGMPLLRVDLGGLKSKFVGESESNLRKVFEVIKAMGRVVVWFDEIEKALGGAINGAADGGVSSDALGAILTWMQERQGEAFVCMTANDVSALPPEFLRKGRFDEMFFIDLPSASEREEIIKASLRLYDRSQQVIDDIILVEVADATAGFSGAEIAAIIPDAMHYAFADGGRQIVTEDLVNAAGAIVPLSTTAEEKIEDLRKWAKTRARSASFAELKELKAQVRTLDI